MPQFINSNKLQNHIDRLSSWYKGDKVQPVTVELHLSGVCNHKCVYCSFADYGSKKLMKKEYITQSIDRLKNIGVKAVIFSGGGEPLINKNIIYALEYSKNSGMDVGLITNGSLFTEGIINAVLKYCTWVRISFDAGTKEFYQLLRGVDDFDKVLDNIKTLTTKKKDLHSQTTIGVQSVVTPKSSQYELKRFYDICCNGIQDIDYIQIRPEEIKNINSKPNIMNCFSMFSKLKENDDRLIVSDKFNMDDIEKPLCRAYEFIGAVDVNGDMYLCCHMIGQRSAKYANVLQADWTQWQKKRSEAAMNIDYSKCPKACRGSAINHYLEALTKPTEHGSFL